MCRISNNTTSYLEQYQSILQNMINQISAATLTDSISGSFIVQMIPHHCAAIAMCENLLCYTTNIPLQNIAQNIIYSQQMSIQSMTEVYPRCQNCKNSSSELAYYERQNQCIINHMFCEMKEACSDNNINGNFIREMIPHHMGAVCMSENALSFPLCAELVPQLETIITMQKEGIIEMQTILQTQQIC